MEGMGKLGFSTFNIHAILVTQNPVLFCPSLERWACPVDTSLLLSLQLSW